MVSSLSTVVCPRIFCTLIQSLVHLLFLFHLGDRGISSSGFDLQILTGTSSEVIVWHGYGKRMASSRYVPFRKCFVSYFMILATEGAAACSESLFPSILEKASWVNR